MRLLAPFALLVIVLAAVVWLDDTPTEADLVFVNQNEVFTLDPQRMSYLQDLRLAHALYEGLVRWDNYDFSILPAAAEMPAISDDDLTLRFRLRPETRWSSGDPVTAHDFVYSWRRAILPDTAADYSNLFFVIAGAEDFFRWRTQQTAAFVADPWSDPDAPEARTVRAAIARLNRLLEATNLPEAIAPPSDDDLPAIRAELDRLLEAAETGGPSLAIELASAARTRAWLQSLDDPACRAAEAHWMWRRAKQRFHETVGLTALDDRTLEVRLRQPTAYFLDLLCFGVFHPVHRPTVEGWPIDHLNPPSGGRGGGWHAIEPPPFEQRRWISLSPATGKLEQKHEWAKPGRHVGNGPYLLAEWRYKRDLRLEKNPLYHDAGRVRSDSILARTIEDTNTAVLAFESGQVNWLADVSAEYQSDMIAQRRAYELRYADELEALRLAGLTEDEALASLPPPQSGERRNIHVFPTFGTDFFSFNCRNMLSDGRPNPFAIAAVRRAFTLTVDKQTIVDHVTQLSEPVITTLIPPGSIPGYDSPKGLPHDPDRGRRELAAAGWEDRDGDGLVEDTDGKPFPVIDLCYTTNTPRYKWIALELKAQWERELGVRVELRGSETKFFKEDLKQGKFMIARGNWYGDYGDPTTFLDLCRTSDGNNDRAYSSEYVDGLLEEAEQERDRGRRLALLEECERFLFQEEVPMLPLCQLVQVYMYEPGRVTGLSDHPRLTQFLWQMEVRKP
ncbi:MAG: peptide ABC transporter substrate-binding protein [Planctomycetota bacterium]|nr:peptide ABC transporter substrate-binding protein [Planctomycetota bacterium]